MKLLIKGTLRGPGPAMPVPGLGGVFELQDMANVNQNCILASGCVLDLPPRGPEKRVSGPEKLTAGRGYGEGALGVLGPPESF